MCYYLKRNLLGSSKEISLDFDNILLTNWKEKRNLKQIYFVTIWTIVPLLKIVIETIKNITKDMNHVYLKLRMWPWSLPVKNIQIHVM